MLSGSPTPAVPARHRPASGNAVFIIIAAFIGAVLFTLGAGAVLYLNTQKLTAAAERVQHTQDVISSLQRASLLSERVLYRTHLYLLDKEEDDLNLARSAANNLVTSAVHIHTLVSDNPNPTLSTLIAIADSLGLAIAMVPEPRRRRTSKGLRASPSGAL